MKFLSSSGRIRAAAVVLLVLAVSAFDADAKLIRLRNQLIPAKRATGPAKANAAPDHATVSGLYLLQVHDPLTVQARAQLAAAGVDILRYVPDDAFVVRCRGVHLGSLRALPFVEWVGEYRPEYKVHRALQSRARTLAAAQALDVTVLLVPRATTAEMAQARRFFSSVQQAYRLRSGAVLRGGIAPGQLDALARADFVLWIEPAPHPRLVDEVASKLVAGDGGPHTLLTQSLGYDGAGVKVAVADSGLNNGDAATMHPDLLGRTPAFFYYGALTDAADEHSHGTHVAGIIAGNGATGETDENGALYGLGVAPGASIIAQRIFDADGNFEAPANGFPQLTTDATDAGAVIGSNSWGDDVQGRYDVSAMEYDELVRDASGFGTNNLPYILEFSAGNAGPGTQTIDSPAVAKNVIATGASENDRPDLFIYSDGPEAMADFSSRGPCEDGRIKPDLVAPGTWISSLQSASASDQFAWLPIDSFYQYQGGTSQAGPHVSGAAAVFVQYYRQHHANATPSPALVKAALINSAVDMDDSFGTGPVPNMDEGWGRVDLTPIFDPALSFEFIDQTTRLTNGQVFEQRILIAGRDQPLRVTLAYTDVPGFPGAIPALVNDLDLEVVAPDGTLYRGNQFDNGSSIPQASHPDTLNNVEAVHLPTPAPGEYVIRVRASKVVEDILNAPGNPRQDFALVVSGVLPVPGVGSLFLDRGSYTAPGQILLTLIDTDQAGQPSETVHAVSGTEPAGENVLLTAAGLSGSFTGSLATAVGPPVADGRLQITNGDTIQVTYFDVSAVVNRTATARGDLVAPVLTTPSVTSSFGQEIVSWSTGEPATSIVRYGTNAVPSSLTSAVTNAELVATHSVSLSDLIAGRTYYYYIASADEAGNTGTNSSGGALFSFVAPATAPVLLIDEFGIDPLGGSAPPLSGYTAPLAAIGMNYDVWDVSTLGNFSGSTLRPYRAIFWRVPEFGDPGTAAERLAISNYVYTGGSLFLASMEVLSRLEEVNDLSFTHNVLHAQSYTVDPDSTGAAQIVGSANETVGNGIDATMDYQVYDTLWGGLVGPDLSDTITPSTNATAVLRNGFGDVVGLRWPAVGQQAPGRVVFFTFPFDAVPMGAGADDRVQLARNIIAFLAPGAGGLATVSLDSSAYRLPSVVTVEVGDSNRGGQGTLSVTASTTTQTNGMTVTLQETVRPGVFTGSFALLASTNPPTPGKLRAANGDTLRVDYYTASNTLVSATAAIDIVPPIISNVADTPDYLEAVISWDTSETADALVQFGESPLLGRTAYDANPTTSHSVTVSGLLSDHLYYYQVVSRDAAGNVAVDDNHGNLYTFRTLLPLSAPWADSMDTGATNWSVFTDPNSQCAWTLGVPNNGQESSAHSPPDAWGSNLGGAVIDSASTFLLSPALQLPPGQTTTLSFWHAYDFTSTSDFDIYAFGQVLLITNANSTTPVTLAEYSDAISLGWEQATFDLTPYAGQLIYLAWDYELFSFDTRARPGWLVDDVALTVSTPTTGTVVISNNLWEAVTTLSGPLSRTNTGPYTLVSNAPAGQYTLTFSAVPYYSALPPQTNTLAAGGTITFQGMYSFPDTNHNGISDLWELQYFGVVSSNRTQLTDTDGDGMTDYAEFIAGTNPTNSSTGSTAALLITAAPKSAGTVQLQWPSAAGRGYSVLGSTNGVTWTPVSNWMQATSSNATFTLPAPAPGGPYLFRLQVRP